MPTPPNEFDADAVVAAQQIPVLRIGRLRYEGRLLSIEEWLPFWDRQQQLQRGGETRDPRVSLALYRDYLRVVFPKHRYRFWAPDPVTLLLRQPYTVVVEAMAHFFFLQARAMGASAPEETSPSTSGIDSPSSTPDVATPSG